MPASRSPSAPANHRADPNRSARWARTFQNKQLLVLETQGRVMEHAHDADVGSDGLSIARWRELLGQDADGLSDHEVDQIRRHADAMAHVIVEMFLEQRAAPEE